MAERRWRIREANLLLVEGEEEARFWRKALAVWGRSDVQVEGTSGKANLRAQLRALISDDGFPNLGWLGVAQDADTDAAAAFDRIRGALRAARRGDPLPVPRRSWEQTAASVSRPTVVALVWPDGIRIGDIETMVWEALTGLPAGFMRR